MGLTTYMRRCHLSKFNSKLYWRDEIMKLIPNRWKMELRQKFDAAQTVKQLKEILLKKIRKRHPKYLSKIGYWNLRTEGEAQITALVNRVTREFNASSLEEVVPCVNADCDKCGKAEVIK